MEEKPNERANLETLEDPGTVASPSNLDDADSLESDTSKNEAVVANSQAKLKKGNPLKRLISHLNIYLLLFVLIVVLAAGLVLVGFLKSKKAAAPTSIATQQLSQDELSKLKGSDATVGDAKQTLNIESNAVFSGKVLVKDSIDVAGAIRIGGALNVTGLNVAGTSTFDQIQANKLSLTGDANILGQLAIQKGLTVSGGASFGGPISAPQLTVQSLQLNADLQINRHLDAGGPTPSKSDGNALGGGGTSSVSGTDTAGTVTISTGGGAQIGCFATISFTTKFPDTPHVIISPVGPSAASLSYYVTRSPTGFTICTASATTPGTSFSYDYVVID